MAWYTMIGFAGQSEGSDYDKSCKIIAFQPGDTNRPVKKLACEKLACYFWPVI